MERNATFQGVLSAAMAIAIARFHDKSGSSTIAFACPVDTRRDLDPHVPYEEVACCTGMIDYRTKIQCRRRSSDVARRISEDVTEGRGSLRPLVVNKAIPVAFSMVGGDRLDPVSFCRKWSSALRYTTALSNVGRVDIADTEGLRVKSFYGTASPAPLGAICGAIATFRGAPSCLLTYTNPDITDAEARGIADAIVDILNKMLRKNE
ncbi:MAG: hypothetical protein R3A47_11960 [Polyangiales bacterium]